MASASGTKIYDFIAGAKAPVGDQARDGGSGSAPAPVEPMPQPAPKAPTTASTQDYVIPADVVHCLGTRYFDTLVQKTREQSGQPQNSISQFDASLDEEV